MVYQQNDAKEAERRTLGDVLEALGRSEFEEAYRLADGAIRGGALEPALFNARAIWLQQQGRFAEALTDFECARASFPRDPALLGSIGACLFHLQRFQRAVSALDLAIAARPDNTTAHYVRGLALQSMSEPEAARRAFERTLSLKPDYLEAIMSLASLMAQMGRGAEASELAKRALALDSGLPEAILILARIESEAGDDDAVEKRLWPHLDDTRFADGERMSARGLVANALDRQGRTKEAFELYEKINEERRNEGAPKFAVGRAIDNVRGLTNYFERSVAWPPSPTGATHSLAPAGHVFLLGFMRSGTTLLASILASNPQIVAVDERDFLQESSQFFLGGDDGVDRLDRLDAENLARRRSDYWQSVYKQAGPVAGKVFVDKMPLNSINLPLIARFFPEAKVLMAVRDPRDVVLSAFRNQFVLHPDSFEFLRLEDCARYYAAVMRLADLCFRKLPLTWLEHRYETLIEDFEGSVRRICGFIGLEWTEAMRDFRQGMSAINIRGVSAPQLRRGLYGEAAGQWRRYREHLAPVFPILQPWIEKFGYPPD